MYIRRRHTTARVLTMKPVFFDSIPKNFARNGRQWETHFFFEIDLTIRKMLSVGWIESPPSKVLFGFQLNYNKNNIGAATGTTAVELACEISDVIILCSEAYNISSDNNNDGRVVKELRGVNSLIDMEKDFPAIYREIWEDIGRRVATLAVREKPHAVYVAVEAFTVKGTEHLDQRKEAAVQRVLRNYYS